MYTTACLSNCVGWLWQPVGMRDPAQILMLSGVARVCPDCLDQRLFVPTDECEGEGCEFACTSCGAALSIDPAFDYADDIAVRVA